ncbi:MAG: hypothetical protein M1165_00355 [Candidatus Pacearchaeota archaeon]|nr:hypothetical protein [Candidatus Pacearchaeota archaeon]MDE1848420.1 hypothetical protein [Nanoarchaeota archaeon]
MPQDFPPQNPNVNPMQGPPPIKPDVNEILKKYGSKIESQINTAGTSGSSNSYSKAYSAFKEEMAPAWSRYEKWCHSLGNIIKLNISQKDEVKVRKSLNIAHLDVEPWQSVTLSAMTFFIVFLLGIFISVTDFLFTGNVPVLFFMMLIVFSLFLFSYISGYPERFANQWRLKASSQMVPAILYIVVYMRHTSNLERAISFAAEHLQYPLALDFKKIFYDVEVGKFSTIKESLDYYLDGWRDYSPEFIESFHLIESSLFEPDDNARIATLEKALQVILDGVYDKMLKFVHDVRSPIQSTYMLGTTLPVLGLALLPLASLMVGNLLKASHVFLLYNLIIPFLAFFLMNKYMLMRPGGYGETSLLERNPLYSEYKSKVPYAKAFILCLPLFFLGFLPLLWGFTPLPQILGLPLDPTFAQLGLGFLGGDSFFGFQTNSAGTITGPFGVGALILGMFIPLGLALFFSIAYKEKTKNLIKERENTKELESEFNNSLFQLGNRIGNGTPPELVFGKVAESTTGLRTSDFFKRVNYNIQQGGMGVEAAVFDQKRGAINYYPSDLIATSMRILIEASKKGLKVAAVSLMSISEYVKNVQKISDRLRDLLAEIISDMKSNMTFLAPLLAGVVVGLAGMITTILSKLGLAQEAASAAGTASQLGNIGNIISLFNVTNMIPPYYLQIAIGVYLVQIIFILTGTLVTIDSGEDKLEKANSTGKNLKRGIALYFIVSLLSTLALFILSSVVLGNLTS